MIKRSSLTAKFTRICMIITAVTALVLSAVFIINSRAIIQRQVTASTMDNIQAFRDQLLARFAEWDALMRFTAANASSIITQEPFDAQAMHNLLRRYAALQPAAMALFATSNVP